MSRQAVAILSTENLLHNISIIRSKIQSSKIIAMVKANAYGHGLRSVSKRIENYVDFLGVASIDEALALREAGVNLPILLAEGVFQLDELSIACSEKFHVVFHHETQLDWLEKYQNTLNAPLYAWIKIDTGLGRLGFNNEEGKKNYQRLLNNSKIAKPVRILSHFACADEKDHCLNPIQIQRFIQFKQNIPSEFSFCNSAAIFHYPECHYDYVRPGIGIYGVSPLKDKTAFDLGLKPVMTLQSRIISINPLSKGSTVGYNARYICPENMQVGIVAIGYGDGYPISAQDGTPVLVNGCECPLVGRISMDMLAVDLRSCPQTKIGDPVVLWGEGLPIERVVKYTRNIVWDLLTGVQFRVKFIWQ